MNDPTLDHLLSCWSEAAARGEDPGAVELCRDCPERVAEVAPLLDALRRIRPFLASPAELVSTVYADPPAGPLPREESWPCLPRYRLQSELGRGGMGVVYLARQHQPDRLVALKMLRADSLTPEDLARFENEANVVASIDHPGVVRLYETGWHEGRPYFAQEFCPGGSLAHRLRGRPLPPDDAARMLERIARAVEAAHARGVIHRDLKPGNILLGADGAPRVADFGLAKRAAAGASLTPTDAVLGTPAYMSPEQARGQSKAVGPPADVYALGAILYECLTGRPPFKAATTFDTLLQVLNEDPIPPRRLEPTVPRDLETLCLACLAKEPARRHPGAGALADELGRFLRREPIHSRPVGSLEKASLWARRRPAVAALLALAVGLLLGGTALSTYFGLLAESRARRATEALRSVEESLADGLLRPLGHREGSLNEYELTALEELAGLPPDRERVRLLFLEQALAEPARAAQLGRRLAPAVLAAVGVSPARREAALARLARALLDPDCPPATLRVAARAVAELAGTEPVLIDACVRALEGELRDVAKLTARREEACGRWHGGGGALLLGLARAAGRAADRPSVRALTHLLESVPPDCPVPPGLAPAIEGASRTIAHPVALVLLARLAERLPPEQAARPAEVLARAALARFEALTGEEPAGQHAPLEETWRLALGLLRRGPARALGERFARALPVLVASRDLERGTAAVRMALATIERAQGGPPAPLEDVEEEMTLHATLYRLTPDLVELLPPAERPAWATSLLGRAGSSGDLRAHWTLCLLAAAVADKHPELIDSATLSGLARRLSDRQATGSEPDLPLPDWLGRALAPADQPAVLRAAPVLQARATRAWDVLELGLAFQVVPDPRPDRPFALEARRALDRLLSWPPEDAAEPLPAELFRARMSRLAGRLTPDEARARVARLEDDGRGLLGTTPAERHATRGHQLAWVGSRLPAGELRAHAAGWARRAAELVPTAPVAAVPALTAAVEQLGAHLEAPQLGSLRDLLFAQALAAHQAAGPGGTPLVPVMVSLARSADDGGRAAMAVRVAAGTRQADLEQRERVARLLAPLHHAGLPLDPPAWELLAGLLARAADPVDGLEQDQDAVAIFGHLAPWTARTAEARGRAGPALHRLRELCAPGAGLVRREQQLNRLPALLTLLAPLLTPEEKRGAVGVLAGHVSVAAEALPRLEEFGQALAGVATPGDAEAAKLAGDLTGELLRYADAEEAPVRLRVLAALDRCAALAPAGLGTPHVAALARIRLLVAGGDEAEAHAAALRRVCAAWLRGADAQQTLELLRSPACVGPARDAAIARLRTLSGRERDGLWQLVAWAGPGFDLEAPARRPAGPPPSPRHAESSKVISQQ